MKFLINFWDYCFYRVYCFYKRHPIIHSNFAFGASTAIGATHMWHIMSLTILWSAIFDCECNAVYPIIISILLMFYYDSHVYTEAKYGLLAKKYKREKHKKIKGWGVFLYIIISILMFFVLSVLLGDRGRVYFPEWLRYFDTRIIEL